jgi:hypothetical protein
MKNIFCVTSYNSVGCSFIDWSVYFLTGQAQHYNVKLKSCLPVSQNPVTPLNAHGHKKNHPFGYAETQQYLDHIKSVNDNKLHSIYPTAILFGMAAEYLNLPADSIRNPDDFNSITQFKKNDFGKVLKLCEHQQIKTVYVASDPATILYFDKKRTVSALLLNYNTPADSIQHVKEDFHETFFNQSLSQWKNLGLTEIWDVRERMALDTRPFGFDIEFTPPFSNTLLWVNSLDLWTRTPWVIKKIMNHLQLPIDSKRFDQWLTVCSSWQKIQLDILDFCYNQQHIVEAIVNDWYYEIDLTFDQEVIIQHCLIYQRGLNLKTWQLKKFPNNTKDLHKLLEPNTHPIGN